MPERRILYVTARRLRAYTWQAGALSDDGIFESDDDNLAAFARYLGTSPKSLYYVVADVTEEDFFQENIPYVRGRDRRTLLQRKIAQRYRDTSLALALSLGTQQGTRREDRILFSSFTNTQQFQPWLAALRTNECRLVGVYSLALIAPILAKRLKLAATRCIVVTLQEAGMRQSYVQDGQIRFSRMGRTDPANANLVAEACAAESSRIFQYLLNLRILPRETAELNVVAFAPEAHWPVYRAAWGENARLRLELIDPDSACHQLGLKSAPPDLLGERLFFQVLATSQPAVQFASDALRRFYLLWRARVALLTGGAALFAVLLLTTTVRYADVLNTGATTESEQDQIAAITRKYDGLQARFPKTPVPRKLLKATVDSAAAILRQTAFPDRFFAEISQALGATPRIELDKIDWNITNDPLTPQGTKEQKPGAASARQESTDASGKAGPYFQVAVLSAHINAIKASDYRGIQSVVNRFVRALRQRPGLNVIETHTPFDSITEKTVSGDASQRESDEAPRIRVTVTRRIGT